MTAHAATLFAIVDTSPKGPALSSTTLLAPSALEARPRPRRDGGWTVLALLVGLLGMAIAVVVPFAPVMADQTTVSWPGPAAAPVSTTAFFVPYRPAELHADVPCTAIQAGLAAPGRATVLATTVVRDSGPAVGLVVDTEDGRLRVLLNGRQVLAAQPPATECGIGVDSTDIATVITVGGAVVASLPGEPVPEIFAFTTDLTPRQAQGMTVTARARTWFESVPTTEKYALLGAHAGLVLLSLGLLARNGSYRRLPASVAPRRWRICVRALIDAVVMLALTIWMVIGPQTDDDGYAAMTIRNGLASGDIGNYYHWFNASEAPFTLVQHLIQPLVALTIAPVWLRLPTWLVGVVAWFVISRGVIGSVLPYVARTGWVRALAALCFLAWWLPYNMGVRPEPVVALAAAAVLALVLRGTSPRRTRGLLQLGAAALITGVAVSVTPSGVVVFAPILVLLPRIWRTLTDGATAGDRLGWRRVAGRVALLGALASVGITLMFADQTWHGARKATELHTAIGPSLEWYEEVTRYGFLLSGGSQGTATKRLPVLLTIVLLLFVTVLIARRVRTLRGLGEVHILTACMAVGFLPLWLTPSKWTHHFGSLAGVGAGFLVVAVVVIIDTARHRWADRAVAVVGLAGGAVTATAAGLSFSGANAWYYLYPDDRMPWFDVPVRPLGVPLNNPGFWIVTGIAVAGAVALAARRRGRDVRRTALITAAGSPATIAMIALTASVAVLAVGFALAPIRQASAGSYSLAQENIEHVAGSSCGMADKVQVMPDVPGGRLEAVEGGAQLDGFVKNQGYLSSEPPPDLPGTGSATFLWGSLASGELSTGSLTSPWFDLPALTGDQELAVSVAGQTGGTNRLALEFGRSLPGTVRPVSQRVLDDESADTAQWRPLAVASTEIPAGVDRVRIQAVDAGTDNDGWLAVTGPRLREMMPLVRFLEGRGPILVDWPMAFIFPCVRDFPRITDGLAETPRVLLAVSADYAATASITYDAGQGGSFFGTEVAGSSREIPSRLVGSPGTEWGHVLLLDYPASLDEYRTSTGQARRWGWEGDR